MLTILTNRLGDCFFLLSLAFISMYGDFRIYNFYNNYDLYLFGALMLAGFTKRAQYPFSA
jgi:prepilin signal peptidase PulO-like enzyme (type II secretory pathway)